MMKKLDYFITKVESDDLESLKRIALLFQKTDRVYYKLKYLNICYNYFLEWTSSANNRINYYWKAETMEGEILGAIILKCKNVLENNESARIDIRIKKILDEDTIALKLLCEMSSYAIKIGKNSLTFSSNVVSNICAILNKYGAEVKDQTIEKIIDLEYYKNQGLTFKFDYADKYRIAIKCNNYSNELINNLTICKPFLDDRPVGSREMLNWNYSTYWLEQEGITKKRIVENWCVFILYHEFKVIGYCEIDVYSNSKVAYLSEIAIHPSYRNSGLGKYLLFNSIEYIMKCLRNVKFIRTLNSKINEPICKLTNEFGFFENNKYNKWVLSAKKIKKVYETD